MRAVRNTDNGIEVLDVPSPDPERGQLRVEVRAAGICGSDLHLISWGPMPVTLGHEISGRLDDGTPVAIWPLVSCGECDRCAAGEVTQCRQAVTQSIGIGRDGGMADEMVVEESCVVPLPEGVDLAHASLVEPIACSLHALRRAALRGDQRGAGGGARMIRRSAAP